MSDPNYSMFRELVAEHGTNTAHFKQRVEQEGIENAKKS